MEITNKKLTAWPYLLICAFMYFGLVEISNAQEEAFPGVDLNKNETQTTESPAYPGTSSQSEIGRNKDQLSEEIFSDETLETDLIEGNSQPPRNGNCYESNIGNETNEESWVRFNTKNPLVDLKNVLQDAPFKRFLEGMDDHLPEFISTVESNQKDLVKNWRDCYDLALDEYNTIVQYKNQYSEFKSGLVSLKTIENRIKSNRDLFFMDIKNIPKIVLGVGVADFDVVDVKRDEVNIEISKALESVLRSTKSFPLSTFKQSSTPITDKNIKKEIDRRASATNVQIYEKSPVSLNFSPNEIDKNNITTVRVARFQLFRVYPNFSKTGEDQSGMKPIENNYIKTSDLHSQYCYDLQGISKNEDIDLNKICFIENELSLNETIKHLRISSLNEETSDKLHDMVDLIIQENDRSINNFDKSLKSYNEIINQLLIKKKKILTRKGKYTDLFNYISKNLKLSLATKDNILTSAAEDKKVQNEGKIEKYLTLEDNNKAKVFLDCENKMRSDNLNMANTNRKIILYSVKRKVVPSDTNAKELSYLLAASGYSEIANLWKEHKSYSFLWANKNVLIKKEGINHFAEPIPERFSLWRSIRLLKEQDDLRPLVSVALAVQARMFRDPSSFDLYFDFNRGLSWTKFPQNGQQEKLIFKELIDLANNYNNNQYAGLEKWRIPSLDELRELLSSGVEENGDILKALNLPRNQLLATSTPSPLNVSRIHYVISSNPGKGSTKDKRRSLNYLLVSPFDPNKVSVSNNEKMGGTNFPCNEIGGK